MSNPAKDVTFSEKLGKSTDVHKAQINFRQATARRGLNHAVVGKRKTALSLCAGGMEHSSTHPTTGPLVPALKQPDSPWQDGIYALLFQGK